MIPTWLGRLGYRAAYILLVAFSRTVRPRTRGVKCLLKHDGDLLLVRHSYGPRKWDLPGGFCRRNEPFEDAARREVGEELGVEDARYTDLGELVRRFHGRRETLHGFRVELADRDVSPQSFEVAEARWFPAGELPDRLGTIVEEVIAMEAGLPRGSGG